MQERDFWVGAHFKKAEVGWVLSLLQRSWKIPPPLCLWWGKAGQKHGCWRANVKPPALPSIASVMDWSCKFFILYFKSFLVKALLRLFCFTLPGPKTIFKKSCNYFTYSREYHKHDRILCKPSPFCVYWQWRPSATLRETISVKWSIRCSSLISEADLFIVTGSWPGSLC